jgi:uncharacterized protein (UPF0332 family)
MKDLETARLKQARESLDEAQALLEAGMDTGRVMTNLYYAFYYPVLALMNEGRVPETMQSVTLGLFERQYIAAGAFKQEYGDALRRVFDVKPACSGEKTPIALAEVDGLMALARSFQTEVEDHIAGKRRTDREERMAAEERRTPKGSKMRSGTDRRKANDPAFKGPERRSGTERRSGKDRRRRP